MWDFGLLLPWRKRMLRIKRTKQAAVHYATAVTPAGIVEGWSADPGAAVAVTDGAARRVQARYEGKPNAGTLSFEPVSATGAQLAQAVAVDDAVGAAEFAELQAECRRLRDQVNELLGDLDREETVAAKAKAACQAGAERVTELEKTLAEQGDRLAQATARIAELEAEPKPKLKK